MNEKLALANSAVGFLLPNAIALVNQRHWRPHVKRAVAFVACAAAATLTTYVGGDLHPDDIIFSILVVFGATQLSYRALWQPSGVTDAIEKATSTDPAP